MQGMNLETRGKHQNAPSKQFLEQNIEFSFIYVWGPCELSHFMQNLFSQANQITMYFLHVILASPDGLVFPIIRLVNAETLGESWGCNSSFRRTQKDEYQLAFALALKQRKAEQAQSRHFHSEHLCTLLLLLCEVFLAPLPTVVCWAQVETLGGTYCFNI